MERREYAVIAVVEDNGQIVCDKVVATSPMNAFWHAAKLRQTGSGVEFVVAMPWNEFVLMQKREHLEFPGSAVVSLQTVLEQPEVFNHKEKK